MEKYFTYDQAMDSKLYSDLIDGAVVLLTERGFFSCEEVLVNKKYGANLPDIRWDYIQRHIQEHHDIELIPLSKRFFDKKKRGEVRVPSVCIAGGRRKKAVGYASVRPENADLVIATLNWRKNMANGIARRVADTAASAEGFIQGPQIPAPVIGGNYQRIEQHQHTEQTPLLETHSDEAQVSKINEGSDG